MNILTNDWYQTSEIVIFGFGNMANTYFNNISKMIKIIYIIDNKLCKKINYYNDIPIYSYEEVKESLKNKKIVIMTEAIVYRKIANLLEKDDFIENKDFTTLERFVCEWGYNYLNKIYLLEVHTAITTKCMFNCKKCNMFIPYYKKKVEYSFEDLKENIDLLFKYVDYIFKYQIVGGEPFLHKELGKYIDYIYGTYHNKIGCIRIITNGSVVPDQELVNTLKDCKCEVHVSNYLHAINYENTYNKSVGRLKKNEVNCNEMISLRWRDIGFPEKPYNFEESDIKKHMNACGTSWHGLVDKRLYYCNSAWSATKCGLFKDNPGDYVELEELSSNTAVELLDLCLGNLKQGYNSFCRLCGGCGDDNRNFIQAGEQKHE